MNLLHHAFGDHCGNLELNTLCPLGRTAVEGAVRDRHSVFLALVLVDASSVGATTQHWRSSCCPSMLGGERLAASRPGRGGRLQSCRLLRERCRGASTARHLAQNLAAADFKIDGTNSMSSKDWPYFPYFAYCETFPNRV